MDPRGWKHADTSMGDAVESVAPKYSSYRNAFNGVFGPGRPRPAACARRDVLDRADEIPRSVTGTGWEPGRIGACCVGSTVVQYSKVEVIGEFLVNNNM